MNTKKDKSTPQTFTNGKFPDFLISGFQKCATSALSINLNNHEKIRVARTDHPNCRVSSGKEFNYFTSQVIAGNTSSGCETVDWYKSHFDSDSDMCQGECSPSYSYYPGDVCSNIKRLHAGVYTKFIFSIRNPIYRTYSSYNHWLQEPYNFPDSLLDPNLSFLENIMNCSSILLSYSNTINEFIKNFGRDRIHIVIQERLEESPNSEYNKIFKFLGLGKKLIDNKSVHSREKKRELSTEEKTFLKGYFRDEVMYCKELLNDPLSEWKEFSL